MSAVTRRPHEPVISVACRRKLFQSHTIRRFPPAAIRNSTCFLSCGTPYSHCHDQDVFPVCFYQANLVTAEPLTEFPSLRSHYNDCSRRAFNEQALLLRMVLHEGNLEKGIAQQIPSSVQKRTIGGAVCSCQASDSGPYCSLSERIGLILIAPSFFPVLVENGGSGVASIQNTKELAVVALAPLRLRSILV